MGKNHLEGKRDLTYHPSDQAKKSMTLQKTDTSPSSGKKWESKYTLQGMKGTASLSLDRGVQVRSLEHDGNFIIRTWTMSTISTASSKIQCRQNNLELLV